MNFNDLLWAFSPDEPIRLRLTAIALSISHGDPMLDGLIDAVVNDSPTMAYEYHKVRAVAQWVSAVANHDSRRWLDGWNAAIAHKEINDG
jgi:hypothetical protein